MRLLLRDRWDMESNDLPEFDRPPVVETVMGLQFDPARDFHLAHFGSFWKEIKDEFPRVREAPFLTSQFETFDPAERRFIELSLQATPIEPHRAQFISEDEHEMIQLQTTRFHSNWIGLNAQPYPGFEENIKRFKLRWNRFLSFLDDWKIDHPVLNQWEVTYVNHVPRGTLWNEPEEWSTLFAGVLPGTKLGLPEMPLESLQGEWHFRIPSNAGRLHVRLQHVLRTNKDNTDEALSMNLTARGPLRVDAKDVAGIENSLRTGRATIVKSFRDMTSPEAHDYWGIKR